MKKAFKIIHDMTHVYWERLQSFILSTDFINSYFRAIKFGIARDKQCVF
jgi:ABC-type transporter Mla maintaining outer membrane lipid asymmetry permease subunit MlaE